MTKNSLYCGFQAMIKKLKSPILEISVPFNIPNVDVLNQEITPNGDIIVTVESKDNGTNCKNCGKRCTRRHGKDEPILWIIFFHEVALDGSKYFIIQNSS